MHNDLLLTEFVKKYMNKKRINRPKWIWPSFESSYILFQLQMSRFSWNNFDKEKVYIGKEIGMKMAMSDSGFFVLSLKVTFVRFDAKISKGSWWGTKNIINKDLNVYLLEIDLQNTSLLWQLSTPYYCFYLNDFSSCSEMLIEIRSFLLLPACFT